MEEYPELSRGTATGAACEELEGALKELLAPAKKWVMQCCATCCTVYLHVGHGVSSCLCSVQFAASMN